MDLPLKNGDFPQFFVCLPEGNHQNMVNTEGTTGTTRARGQKCSSCGLMRDCGGCTTDVVLICVCHAFEHEFVAQGFLLCYNCYGPFYPSFAAFRASPCLEGL